MTNDLRKKIEAIPGDEGWNQGIETVLEVAEEMVQYGNSECMVFGWIRDIYWASEEESKV